MDKVEKQKILEELGSIPEDLYDELVRSLIEQVREKIAEIKESLDSDDYDGVAESAHFVKGASGNLRIRTIHKVAESMEAMSRKRDGKEANIPLQLERLEEELVKLEQSFGSG